MTEGPLSSNKRIQLLRERLELYNATIEEAMGVVTGVTGAEKTAIPTSDANTNNNVNTANWRWTKDERGAAPQLDRDLSEEFNAVRVSTTTNTNATNTTSKGSGAANFDSSGSTAAAARGGGGGGGTRRRERRMVPPPPSPPNESAQRHVHSCSTSSTYRDESTSMYTSDSDEGDFVSPFLNEAVSVDEIASSLRKMHRAAVAAGGGGGKSSGKDAGTGATNSYRKSPVPHESNHNKFTDRHNNDDDDFDNDCDYVDEASFRSLTPSPPPPPPSREVKVEGEKREESARTEAAVPSFAKLEASHHKLSVAEQAILKLQQTVGIERFPRQLPQRQQALQLAQTRDELIKKEQALRLREPTGSSLATIYETDALNVDKQIQQLLKDCNSAKTLFVRVQERKAAVAEKEKLLKKKLSELEDCQRDVREKRQALMTLERRNEQREALLITREGNYRRDLEAHKEREKSLQHRINEVEELGHKVTSWMKILEERDTKIAAKEKRLCRVQIDLERRSEELLCYRNSRAKQPTRTAPRQASSPR